MMTKTAMDAAIAEAQAAERRNQTAIREAERAVRPFVGEISHAFDSAPAVYRHALKMLGVKDADTLHDSALKTVLGYQKTAAHRTGDRVKIAADSAAAGKGFDAMFPAAARIGNA